MPLNPFQARQHGDTYKATVRVRHYYNLNQAARALAAVLDNVPGNFGLKTTQIYLRQAASAGISGQGTGQLSAMAAHFRALLITLEVFPDSEDVPQDWCPRAEPMVAHLRRGIWTVRVDTFRYYDLHQAASAMARLETTPVRFGRNTAQKMLSDAAQRGITGDERGGVDRSAVQEYRELLVSVGVFPETDT